MSTEPTSTEVAIVEFAPIVKQSGLEKAEQYAAIFSPFMVTLKQLSDKATGVNHDNPTAIDAKIARGVRLALVKNRTATAKQKDLSKATLMAETNLIQNLHNVVINSSQLIEADLEAVEKFAENKEKERKAALAVERSAMFSEFGTDLTGYDLGSMAESTFNDLLESQRLLHEKRVADAIAAEAARIEAERLEQERQAALKAENERLKAEAEEAEKKIAAERTEAERLAKIEKEKADKLAKENADKLAAIQAENERVRKKAADELKASQEAAAKAQAQLKEKQDAEKKAADEKLAAEKKAAKVPVKEKLKIAVTSLVLELPDSEITADVLAKFNGFKTWALQQIEHFGEANGTVGGGEKLKERE